MLCHARIAEARDLPAYELKLLLCGLESCDSRTDLSSVSVYESRSSLERRSTVTLTSMACMDLGGARMCLAPTNEIFGSKRCG